MNYKKRLDEIVNYLSKKKKILFLTTSNRWNGKDELPKSSILAEKIANLVGREKVKIIDVANLKIYVCEGNVSCKSGNDCGVKKAFLNDKEKNPSGCHRCWASINNKDDELWKISKELFESDCVIFFGSVRWGQTNSVYQKLIERLTWIENRHSTLGESNLLKNTDVGFIFIGQNWNGSNVLKTQKKVLGFYGFHVVEKLFLNWQYTKNFEDETSDSYAKSYEKFKKDFGI